MSFMALKNPGSIEDSNDLEVGSEEEDDDETAPEAEIADETSSPAADTIIASCCARDCAECIDIFLTAFS